MRPLPTALAAGLFALCATAQATPAAPVACSASDLSMTASFMACAGYSSGNLIAGSPDKMAEAAAALSSLGLSGADGSWIEKVEIASGSTISFATPLYGVSYIGIHRGGAGQGGQGTAFYKIDAGDLGLTTLTLQLGGLSNAAIYATAALPVPEPTPAAMLLAGLAGIAVLRRRRVAAA